MAKAIKDEKHINPEAERALMERVAWYSVAVAGTERDIEHGTGIPIVYEGTYFIITCLHIVDDILPDQVRFIWRTEESIAVKDKNKLKEGMKEKSFKYTEMKKLPIKQIHKASSNKIDLAAIELDGIINEKGLDFFDLQKGYFDIPQVGLDIIMMGYAGEIAEPFKIISERKEGHMLFLHTDWPEIIEARDLPEFCPEIHFLMKTHPSDQSVNPKGMSGCGIWTWSKVAPNQMWYPKVKLIGIQSAQYKQSKLFKATRVNSLLELLNK